MEASLISERTKQALAMSKNKGGRPSLDNDILLLKELEIEKPIMMGYSMGGFIAALVAAEMEVQAVILLDGAAKMSEHQKPIVEPSFARLGISFESEGEYINQITANYASYPSN